MLTPMLVQYVVGLCCTRRNPEAVDVTVGDLVLDVAAQKERDVDITVTLAERDGTLRAFKAYEVKRESEPLDVAKCEQLCAKLRDMPQITHRAIVSASGFTQAAVAKAAANNVELFDLNPWTKPIGDQFPALAEIGRPVDFVREVRSNLLCWVDYKVHLEVPGGPSFRFSDATPTFAENGGPHKKFANMSEFTNAVLLRSTQILFPLEPAETIARTFQPEPIVGNEEFQGTPRWPHTHTLSLLEEPVFLEHETHLRPIHSATISGYLQWQSRRADPEFFILESVPGRNVFAGAAVADLGRPEGKMFAMIFSPDSRTFNFHNFQLLEKHKNAIRQLKIQVPRIGGRPP
jgi:hypothetical protein